MSKRTESFHVDECDDISYLLDSIIGAPGAIEKYRKNPGKNWILYVGDMDIEEGLQELSEMQQQIIELLFFKGYTFADISNELCISHAELIREIKSMRMRLMKHV